MYLRKLTKKSLLKFGRYKDLTVLEVLNLNNTRYLRWVYFNCSLINFFDDILDEIKVYPEFRIEKPGTNPEFDNEINSLMDDKMPLRTKKHMKSQAIGRLKTKTVADKNLIGLSVDSLRLKNQGHDTSRKRY